MKEQDLLLLRPRSSAPTAGAEEADAPGAVLLPRHGSAAASAHVLPSSGRLWLPRMLLVAGAVYAVLMLVWSSQNLSVIDSAASQANVAATQPSEGDVMDLAAILKAANHPETNEEREIARQQAQTKLQAQQDGRETAEKEEPTVHEATPIPTQAAIDRPMEASEMREALRLAREAVVARMEAEGSTRDQTSISGSQKTDEQRRQEDAEEEARDTLLLPKGETKPRSLKCLGWRSTGGCSPYGPRNPENDFSCTKLVPYGHSGYCEVEDTETGERFRVMRRYCSSSKWDTSFRCADASNFVNFHYKAREAADEALAPGFALPNVVAENASDEQGQQQRDGIVMVVYPKLVPSAYATIKTLREVLGCRLPIEIWYRNAEMNADPNAMKPLTALAADNETSTISFHEITDWHAAGYGTKVFAIYNSFFERILFLDADNVPTRDPTFLFSSPEFVENGAVFWPDFWHPGRTIFNIHAQSLLWELIDMPFINMFEQESGQILIDRRRHTEALELVKFYTFHRPSLFDYMKLVHGDKDLFRLAWLKLGAPFHMIEAPAAVAGKVINESFCGLTMVQHDAQGDVLFLHRNSHKLMGEPLREQVDYRSRAITRSRKKAQIRQKYRLEGKEIPPWSELDAIVQADETPAPTVEPPEADGYPDSTVWTHLLSFNNASKQEDYYIQTYNADPEFPKSQNCYGERYLNETRHFYAQEIAELPFAVLETDLRRFAVQAVQIKWS
jgi:alpha 1,2-mannosyltransferase